MSSRSPGFRAACAVTVQRLYAGLAAAQRNPGNGQRGWLMSRRPKPNRTRVGIAARFPP